MGFYPLRDLQGGVKGHPHVEEVVFFDFMKGYTLMNKPSKWHNCTIFCSG